MNEIESSMKSLNFHITKKDIKSLFSDQHSEASSSTADGSFHNKMEAMIQNDKFRGKKRKMESLEDQTQRLTQIVVEECMSRAVIRKCWLCRRRYVKDGAGCNAVHCVCGAVSCFHCGRRIARRIHLGCPAVTTPDELRMAVLTAAGRARASKRPRLAARILCQESSSSGDDDDDDLGRDELKGEGR